MGTISTKPLKVHSPWRLWARPCPCASATARAPWFREWLVYRYMNYDAPPGPAPFQRTAPWCVPSPRGAPRGANVMYSVSLSHSMLQDLPYSYRREVRILSRAIADRAPHTSRVSLPLALSAARTAWRIPPKLSPNQWLHGQNMGSHVGPAARSPWPRTWAQSVGVPSLPPCPHSRP